MLRILPTFNIDITLTVVTVFVIMIMNNNNDYNNDTIDLFFFFFFFFWKMITLIPTVKTGRLASSERESQKKKFLHTG